MKMFEMSAKPEAFISKIETLTGTSAGPYLACRVEQDLLRSCEVEFLHHFGERMWDLMVRQKRMRDHDGYHVTIIEPAEYKPEVARLVGMEVRVKLIGCGVVRNGSDISAHVVVASDSIQDVRRQEQLKFKDLHVTMGFLWHDVHDVRKNDITLIRSK